MRVPALRLERLITPLQAKENRLVLERLLHFDGAGCHRMDEILDFLPRDLAVEALRETEALLTCQRPAYTIHFVTDV